MLPDRHRRRDHPGDQVRWPRHWHGQAGADHQATARRLSQAGAGIAAMPIIAANGLSKSYRVYQKKDGLLGALRGLFRREYKEVKAVENVTFSIEPGEIVGFLGPNGAGKTTTLKMLSGLIYPTSGTARVLDHVPWERKDAFRRRFSLVMGQKNQLWWDLPAADSFQLHREIYSLPQDYFQRA